jgi:hypothetical protein
MTDRDREGRTFLLALAALLLASVAGLAFSPGPSAARLQPRLDPRPAPAPPVLPPPLPPPPPPADPPKKEEPGKPEDLSLSPLLFLGCGRAPWTTLHPPVPISCCGPLTLRP